MRTVQQLTIDPDHPSIPGHFPGRPIVPGVVVLDQAIALFLRDRPGLSIATLREVKFLSPVIPGDEITVEIVETPDRVTMTGRVGQRTVFRSRAELDVIA